MNKITSHTLNQGSRHVFKTVTAVKDGLAIIVSDDNNTNHLQVTHYSAAVDTLEIGDRVSVRIMNTDVLVEYRLIPIHEISKRPITRRNIEFSAIKKLVLRCGDSTLTLSPDGFLSISGVKVKISAEHETEIKSGIINLH